MSIPLAIKATIFCPRAVLKVEHSSGRPKPYWCLTWTDWQDVENETKSVAVAKKADNTAYDVRRTAQLQNQSAENAAFRVVMVTWSRCLWLFQTRKFRRFGFSLCVRRGWTIHLTAVSVSEKWIGSASLGTSWYNFQLPTPTLSATMHSVTDRRTNDIIMPIIADHIALHYITLHQKFVVRILQRCPAAHYIVTDSNEWKRTPSSVF